METCRYDVADDDGFEWYLNCTVRVPDSSGRWWLFKELLFRQRERNQRAACTLAYCSEWFRLRLPYLPSVRDNSVPDQGVA